MNADQIALLVYGTLSILLVALLAVTFQSRTGLALVCIAAGLTWVFQSVQMAARGQETFQPWITLVLYCSVPVVLVLAFLLTILGA